MTRHPVGFVILMLACMIVGAVLGALWRGSQIPDPPAVGSVHGAVRKVGKIDVRTRGWLFVDCPQLPRRTTWHACGFTADELLEMASKKASK